MELARNIAQATACAWIQSTRTSWHLVELSATGACTTKHSASELVQCAGARELRPENDSRQQELKEGLLLAELRIAGRTLALLGALTQ
jgi:hypothetical protein